MFEGEIAEMGEIMMTIGCKVGFGRRGYKSKWGRGSDGDDEG